MGHFRLRDLGHIACEAKQCGSLGKSVILVFATVQFEFNCRLYLITLYAIEFSGWLRIVLDSIGFYWPPKILYGLLGKSLEVP